jgi:FkbM family methyltransferase
LRENDLTRSAAPIALLECRHGLFFVLRSDVFVGRALEVYGEFSEIEAAFLVSLIRRGATVLDIGANLGAFTLSFAHAVGRRGRVLAFEPQTFLYRIIRANAAVNNLAAIVSAHRVAVGESRGRLDVPIFDYVAVSNFGGFDISLKDFSMQPVRSIRSETVEQIAIDDLGLSACDLIKIDVERMEPDVIAGAMRTIERFRPILYIEVHEKAPALFRSLGTLGYRCWWHHPPLFNSANYRGVSEDLWPGFLSYNAVCLPPGASAAEATVAGHGLVPILDPSAAPGESRPSHVNG